MTGTQATSSGSWTESEKVKKATSVAVTRNEAYTDSYYRVSLTQSTTGTDSRLSSHRIWEEAMSFPQQDKNSSLSEGRKVNLLLPNSPSSPSRRKGRGASSQIRNIFRAQSPYPSPGHI